MRLLIAPATGRHDTGRGHGPDVDGAEIASAEIASAAVDGAEIDGAEVDGAEVDGAEVDEALLRRLYAYPRPLPTRGFVRANMVSTVDGSVAGPDGRSGTVSSPADRLVFSVLRGLADVVLVGAGTVRAEGYRVPAAKREFAALRGDLGQRPAPVLAVVTASGDLPGALVQRAAELAGSAPQRPAPLLVVTSETAGRRVSRLRHQLGDDAVLVTGDDRVDLVAAVQALADRGLGRVLCEGGPSLLRQLVAAGRVDELCHTTSPLLAGGDGPRLLTGPPVPAPSSRLLLEHLLEADGTLLARWLVAQS